MIFDRKSQLVETDSTIPRLLTSQEDEFLIPGIKDAVNLNIEYFPS